MLIDFTRIFYLYKCSSTLHSLTVGHWMNYPHPSSWTDPGLATDELQYVFSNVRKTNIPINR